MKQIIPQNLTRLAKLLNKPLYVVGGACRDYIAGLNCKVRDWDICAPIDAEELSAVAAEAGFTVSAIYKNTGTVRMSVGGEDYEYTCFRTDRYVRGEHTPAKIYFTDDIEKDARRRDFKCNAVYYNVKEQKFEDPLCGIEEIERGVINTVVEAGKVFGEDGLRLMRLARIAAQTGFTPSRECIAGAAENAALIGDIAAERIYAELNAILCADQKYGVDSGPYRGLKLLCQIGVMKYILPELYAGLGMEQREDFHDHDVLEHSLRCVMYSHKSIRLAALLHDVGKPYCKINTGKFACHEIEGERIARDICARLRVSKRLTDRTCALIRWHMYDLSGKTSENKIKKFIVAHTDIYEELLYLKQADYSACKDDASVAPCVTKWRAIYGQMKAAGVPMDLKQLNVRGDKLIAAGVPKEKTSEVLAYLLGECAIGNVPNSEDKLIRFALASLKNL